MLNRPALRGRQSRAPRRRGLSIVELMVGVAVGLVVVAGALTVSARNLSNSHHLLVAARFNQDLRAAADLISRDLRRAGFWGNAILGTQAIGATATTTANPYQGATGTSEGGFTYQFSRDEVENNTLDANESFAFRVHQGALQMQSDAGGWRDVTDTKVMNIADDGLAITPAQTVLPLGHLCARTCAAGTPNCPTTTVRSYAVTLTATAVADTSLVRSLRTTVRLRNDQVAGRCPA